MRRRAFLGAAAWPVVAARARGGRGPAVAVGLERLETSAGKALRGRRVGLVCHAASLTADGRHAIDVLRAVGVRVERLFGPEHGLRGEAAAGATVADGRDALSGIPVVSLYGPRQKPSREDLRGLDALVVDLQDAGVRFYTYASTMLLCLDSAAEAGIEAVVLDRPNPLGGVRVDGPPRDPAQPTSRLFGTPGPLVHGLTLGEMARLARRAPQAATVTVVPMSGWRRAMTWPDTGRPWPTPSPNLRSAEAALAYPGTCLIEATNVSEGRGTDAPFLLLGAPWVEPDRLAREAAAPGFALEPTSFTPRPSKAAPEPKLAGQPCRGVRVRVSDRSTARPWQLGLSLLAALSREAGFAWLNEGAGLDRLTGSGTLREALERGDSVDAILAAERPALERWRSERAPFLLYS